MEEVFEDEDFGLEWLLEVRESARCLLLALEIGEGEDLGIRTGVDIFFAEEERLYEQYGEVLMDGLIRKSISGRVVGWAERVVRG